MTGFLLNMFGISLCLTLVIEIAVGFVLGMRRREQLLLLVLVNILTNLAAVLLCWLGMPQIPVETGVFLVEAGVLYLFSVDDGWRITHPVRLSIVCNGCSWLLGIVLQRIGG